MPERLCLAIETSNPSIGASVGIGRLLDGHAEVLAVEALREVGRNEDDLLPAIARVCASAAVHARDFRVVAVSVGPGGYTSLRVACSAGKMIAEGAGAACVGVASAAVARVGLGGEPGAVGVCLASKEDTVHVTVFPPGWKPEDAVPVGGVVHADAVPLDSISVLIGDRYLPPGLLERAKEWSGRVVEPVLGIEACLVVAARAEVIEPAALNPVYPREPDAVTLWRRRHGPPSSG
jgi:tRNA A37 threonylcarbamoyladenosine modification protein TsaB